MLFLLSFTVFTSCDDMGARMKSKRGGFSKKDKSNLNKEAAFRQLDNDSLDEVYQSEFEIFMTLARKAEARELHDKCYKDFKGKYSKEALERYLKIVYYFTGPIKNYKHEGSLYDYDGASESINCQVNYNTTFKNCNGSTTFALLCYDDETELVDVVFNFDEVKDITPIQKTIETLFELLNNKQFDEAYETASDDFKRINYANYFKTLTETVGKLDVNALDFHDGLIKIHEETSQVVVELGFNRQNYDGLIINYIVQSDGTLRLDRFEYVPA